MQKIYGNILFLLGGLLLFAFGGINFWHLAVQPRLKKFVGE